MFLETTEHRSDDRGDGLYRNPAELELKRPRCCKNCSSEVKHWKLSHCTVNWLVKRHLVSEQGPAVWSTGKRNRRSRVRNKRGRTQSRGKLLLLVLRLKQEKHQGNLKVEVTVCNGGMRIPGIPVKRQAYSTTGSRLTLGADLQTGESSKSA
jgi:hypothetical protein